MLERQPELFWDNLPVGRADLETAIMRSARYDRKRWLVEGTGVDGATQDKWKAVTSVKWDCASDYYARQATAGCIILFVDMAHTMAQPLAT